MLTGIAIVGCVSALGMVVALVVFALTRTSQPVCHHGNRPHHELSRYEETLIALVEDTDGHTGQLAALTEKVAQLEATVIGQAGQLDRLEKDNARLRRQLGTAEQNGRLAFARLTELTGRIDSLVAKVRILTGSRPNWTAAFICGTLAGIVYTLLAVACHPGTFRGGLDKAVTDLVDQVPFIVIIGLTGAAVGLITSAALFRRPLERNEA